MKLALMRRLCTIVAAATLTLMASATLADEPVKIRFQLDWRFDGQAKVNGQLVAEAEVSAMILDPDDAKIR